MPQNATNGLDPRQEQAVFLLASGKTVTATAAEVGVDRMTIYRWVREKKFQAKLDRLRSDINNAAQDRLLALADRAVAVIQEDLNNDSDKRLRQKAAEMVLKGLGLLIGTMRTFAEHPEANPEVRRPSLLEALEQLTPEDARNLLADLDAADAELAALDAP